MIPHELRLARVVVRRSKGLLLIEVLVLSNKRLSMNTVGERDGVLEVLGVVGQQVGRQ